MPLWHLDTCRVAVQNPSLVAETRHLGVFGVAKANVRVRPCKRERSIRASTTANSRLGKHCFFFSFPGSMLHARRQTPSGAGTQSNTPSSHKRGSMVRVAWAVGSVQLLTPNGGQISGRLISQLAWGCLATCLPSTRRNKNVVRHTSWMDGGQSTKNIGQYYVVTVYEIRLCNDEARW